MDFGLVYNKLAQSIWYTMKRDSQAIRDIREAREHGNKRAKAERDDRKKRERDADPNFNWNAYFLDKLIWEHSLCYYPEEAEELALSLTRTYVLYGHNLQTQRSLDYWIERSAICLWEKIGPK